MTKQQRLVTLLWDTDDDGHRWPALRGPSGVLLEPFTSYLEFVVAEQKKACAGLKAFTSRVEAATYAVSTLAEFLIRNNRRLYRIHDEWLIDLRNEMLVDVRANPVSRGSSLASKRTVNVKLVEVYQLLHWAQKNRRLPAGTIGWLKCRVRSSLPESETRGASVDFKRSHLYPVCYQRVGKGSGRDEGQYWATAEDIERIEDHFLASENLQLAVRNILAVRIQQYTAWRNESVNSLTVDQFSEDALRPQRGNPFCLLSPAKQKFDYEKSFAVSWVLIDRIVEYIKFNRQQMLLASGASERDTERRLFISEKGRPLTDDSYGEIIADAFRAIGAPKGSGGHSLRRYRTAEEVKSVVAAQKARGLPTDRDTVTHRVMELLGHNSEEAQRAYDHVESRVFFESRESELWRRLQAAELKRDALRAQLMSLLSHLPGDVLAALPPDALAATLPGAPALADALPSPA